MSHLDSGDVLLVSYQPSGDVLVLASVRISHEDRLHDFAAVDEVGAVYIALVKTLELKYGEEATRVAIATIDTTA